MMLPEEAKFSTQSMPPKVQLLYESEPNYSFDFSINCGQQSFRELKILRHP